MATNLVKFEEASEVVVDQESLTPATGWTLQYAAVLRVGQLAAVHIEATFASGAAALVATLPPEVRPGNTVTSPDGKFTIGSTGAVSYTGSTVTGAAAAALDIVFAAEPSLP